MAPQEDTGPQRSQLLLLLLRLPETQQEVERMREKRLAPPLLPSLQRPSCSSQQPELQRSQRAKEPQKCRGRQRIKEQTRSYFK